MKKVMSHLMILMLMAGMLSFAIPSTAYAKTQQGAVDWLSSMHSKSLTGQCVTLYREYLGFFSKEISKEVGSIDYAMQIATNNLYPSGWTKVTGGVPQPGDIAVYPGRTGESPSTSNPGHVGIVFEVTSADLYYTMDLNLNANCYVCGKKELNKVHVRKRTSPAFAYIRPVFGNTPQLSAPTVTTQKSAYTYGESVTVKWNSVSGATEYWLNICRDGKCIDSRSIGSATSYSWFPEPGRYDVFISACNASGVATAPACVFFVNAGITTPE